MSSTSNISAVTDASITKDIEGKTDANAVTDTHTITDTDNMADTNTMTDTDINNLARDTAQPEVTQARVSDDAVEREDLKVSSVQRHFESILSLTATIDSRAWR